MVTGRECLCLEASPISCPSPAGGESALVSTLARFIGRPSPSEPSRKRDTLLIDSYEYLLVDLHIFLSVVTS